MGVTLDFFLYLIGLLLMVLPNHCLRSVLADASGSKFVSGSKLFKHGLGLALFAIGVIGLHRTFRAEMGNWFLFWSVVLVLGLELGKIWWRTREED